MKQYKSIFEEKKNFKENSEEHFVVEVSDYKEEWVIEINKSGSKWIEIVKEGNKNTFSRRTYQPYLKKKDILEWLRQDFESVVEVKEEEDDEIIGGDYNLKTYAFIFRTDHLWCEQAFDKLLKTYLEPGASLNKKEKKINLFPTLNVTCLVYDVSVSKEGSGYWQGSNWIDGKIEKYLLDLNNLNNQFLFKEIFK